MDFSFLYEINYLPVIVSSVVFFLLGSFWFSTLFGSTWTKELKDHNVTIKQPTSNDLILKMLLTFGANFLSCLAMASLVNFTGSATAIDGLILGIIAAVGFAATTLASVFIWENRSLKLFLIDIGYPAVGIIVSAVLLSMWH